MLQHPNSWFSRQDVHPNEPLRRGRRPQHVAADATLRDLVERYDEFRGGGRLLDFMRTVQYHLSSAKFPGEALADDNPGDAGNDAGNDPAPQPPPLPDIGRAPQAVGQPQGKTRKGNVWFNCTLS